ncbi:MAG: hypothetical protein M1818_001118 [Claussenomyces sp. TS43310]|nr:MAG: hypothetical protein M1818_001118 [Claussenomyces sp. TS43310]
MSSYIPSIVAKPFAGGVDVLRGALGSISWKPVLTVARISVISLFSRIEKGTLILIDDVTERTFIYGQESMKENTEFANGANGTSKSADKKVVLNVHKEAFWVRLFLFADIGFAEAYMLGDVDCSDLTRFFELFILNRDQLANGTTLSSSMAATVTGLARSTNTLSKSLVNASAHYDISNEIFAAFLSEDMTYSCPIWKVTSDGNDRQERLETAQRNKLRHIINGAKIKAGDHVLEIGTGWGSFAIEAVRETGCRVTSLTLSIEQKSLAEKRIAAAGFSDKIEVKLMDYRVLPTPRVPYDKVVSIEMLEAVGREYLQTYFATIDRVLKRNGGIAIFQCITMPEQRYEAYAKGEDFIRKYIFPGGHLPSISQLIMNIQLGSGGSLILDKLENIGGHYPKALRLWKENFLQNFDSRVSLALMTAHAEMSMKDIDVFRRKWEV